MPATNHTQPAQLSQFTDDDKPSWLGDYNEDNRKVQAELNRLEGLIQNLQGQLNGKADKV